MQRTFRIVCEILIACVTAAACAPLEASPPLQTESLAVQLLYPNGTSTIEMGQVLKCIAEVKDQEGHLVSGATVQVSIKDPSGKLQASLPAREGSSTVYRMEGWLIPHQVEAGQWTLSAEAETDTARGNASTAFHVQDSVSETLLGKYGFWIEAPALRGIVPSLVKEQGNAENGVIIWGGLVPLQHIFAESWLEVQWRKGDFALTDGGQVRKFMLGTLGNLGFSPLRQIGAAERTKFKAWDAWQVKVRGQYSRYDGQWMIFYAPEVDKTYAIGTTVVLAPEGIDPHATLRDSFEVHPEIGAAGTAPEPLAQLLPAPELTSPELGTRVIGTGEPIVLAWQPVRELAEDEYYRVAVDFDYGETNSRSEYATRMTELELPASLYNEPNCGVFNWQVMVMKTGTGAEGRSKDKALSYNSLYWYVEWLHPLGEPLPFTPRCPNPQT
jgi:hypothetical protein